MIYWEPSTYEFQTAEKAWSYRSEAGDMRFEVRVGDYGKYGSPATERSEIASYKKFDFRRVYSIRYQFLVEPGVKNTAEWLVMGQLHQTEDKGDFSGPVPFSVELAGEKMRIVGRYTEEVTTTKQPTYLSLYTDSEDLVRGRWYDMKISIRFDAAKDGLVVVWRDGVRLVDYRGPLGYNDQIGPYWKQGVYRATAPETFAVKYRGLSILPVDGEIGHNENARP